MKLSATVKEAVADAESRTSEEEATEASPDVRERRAHR
jgi:hypothetical protein